jgi:hypothetical protein
MRPQAPSFYQSGGFSLGELLVALALGAVVISAATVAFGTLIRNQPRAGSAATVTLSSTLYNAYYGLNVSSQVINVAPNYGAVVQAENMREKFLADTLAATAVFCLSRNTDEPNYTHPFQVSHNVASDTYPYIDCGETFRLHLVAKGLAKNTAPGTVGQTYFTPSVRNYSATAPNASIFVLTYSNVSDTLTGGSGNLLRIKAVYDIDLNRSNSPLGYYASVKRWSADSSTSAARLTDYYDVFYPLSPQANGTPGTWATTTDAFMPLWVAFERPLYTESSTIDAFKKAREHPFYFIWWPDPAAQTLSLYGGTNSSFLTSDPRKAYNLMAGRTSFMFTVPVFPVL